MTIESFDVATSFTTSDAATRGEGAGAEDLPGGSGASPDPFRRPPTPTGVGRPTAAAVAAGIGIRRSRGAAAIMKCRRRRKGCAAAGRTRGMRKPVLRIRIRMFLGLLDPDP
jgi:hypothetical protein